MAHQAQNTTKTPPFVPSLNAPVTLAILAVIAASYFGLMLPVQKHMQSLERQCNKLVIAVKKLQSKDDTARHGLRLINLLDAQGEKLASAEQALVRFSALREQIMREADEMAQVTAALQQLKEVRADVDRYSQTLASAAATLGEMSEMSASITASGEIARQANGSLAALDDLQSGLGNSITQLAQQLSALEVQVDNQSQGLPQAKQSLSQIDELCKQLAEETKSLATARQQLAQLGGLKQEVLTQSANLPAAVAALDQIWDLKEGLLLARGTFDKAQQLAVDMMLLEPVLDQVAKTLQPAADATRLSRRAAAKSLKTRQTADASTSTSPWSSAINVFVALLGTAE